MALHLIGYPLEHPVIRAGIAGLDGFMVREEGPEGPIRRLEACQSPVWDTGAGPGRPARLGPAGPAPGDRAAAWTGCSARRSGSRATGRCAGPDLAPGGWAFEFANDGYPDTDDTAEVVLALFKARNPDGEPVRERRRASMDRGLAWVLGHAEQGRRLGRVRRRQHPHAHQQAAVLRLRRGDRPAVGRRHRAHRRDARRCSARRRTRRRCAGVRWLLGNQERDGSWFGRWGANYVYGTGAVVPALVAAGVSGSHPIAAPGHRLADRASEPGRRLGRGPALVRRPGVDRPRRVHASQTAWALLALLAVGERVRHRGAARGDRPGWYLTRPSAPTGPGTRPVHRHRLPRRLLHQLPPLPAGLPADRPGPRRTLLQCE
jgi:squalene-hopene/tetraprenyl-beta-curcumene cyclase